MIGLFGIYLGIFCILVFFQIFCRYSADMEHRPMQHRRHFTSVYGSWHHNHDFQPINSGWL